MTHRLTDVGKQHGSVCVECGAPLEQLYREYSAGSIRLARCVSGFLLWCC
jgi:uncharacterized protein with PIN domain